MALYPKRLKSGFISVLVGDGANPEVFTKICGASQKSFTLQKNTSDNFIDDCADPEAIPSRFLDVTGFQGSMALNITYNRTQAALIRGLIQSTTSSNMRFEFTEPTGDAVDAGYWEGQFQVTNLQTTGELNGTYATGTMQIESDGPIDWVDVP